MHPSRDAKDKHDRMPLHVAAYEGRAGVAKLLLANMSQTAKHQKIIA